MEAREREDTLVSEFKAQADKMSIDHTLALDRAQADREHHHQASYRGGGGRWSMEGWRRLWRRLWRLVSALLWRVWDGSCSSV